MNCDIAEQRFAHFLIFLPLSSVKACQGHGMRKVIRGYARDKDSNLNLIGTIPVPHSKDKRSPVARQGKRFLVRQGATIFKEETIR
jgi:hypothetical protein